MQKATAKILFTALFIILLAGTSNAQVQKTIKGFLLDESTFAPIPLASIHINSNGSRFLSNRTGFFRINIKPTDSVYITGIGYKQKMIIAEELIPLQLDDTVKIFMRPIVYKLKEVNVESNPKRDSIARRAAEILKNDPLLNNYDRIVNRNKGGFMSPLTAMYEAWSKEGQDMAHFEEFLRYAEQQKEIDRRYNKKVVKKVTDTDDEDLDAFMQFCRLNRQIILSASEYDLYEAIRKCSDEFKAQQLRERTRLR